MARVFPGILVPVGTPSHTTGIIHETEDCTRGILTLNLRIYINIIINFVVFVLRYSHVFIASPIELSIVLERLLLFFFLLNNNNT